MPVESPASSLDLGLVNAQLSASDARDVIAWAHKQFGSGLAMTSSFGAQSAVMLHLCTSVVPNMPVILIDTGYLFPETYTFVEELTKRLNLNLRVVNPLMTAARQEAIFGKLWDQGEAGMDKYLQINKVEPLARAIRELGVTAWCSGVRAQQTDHRKTLRPVEFQNNAYNIHPILKWTSREMHYYLRDNDLPYHPLYNRGYLSIGDTHSTEPITADQDERAGRFKGLKQECGIHLPATPAEDQSRQNSDL